MVAVGFIFGDFMLAFGLYLEIASSPIHQPPLPKQILVFLYVGLRVTSTWKNAYVAGLSVKGRVTELLLASPAAHACVCKPRGSILASIAC